MRRMGMMRVRRMGVMCVRRVRVVRVMRMMMVMEPSLEMQGTAHRRRLACHGGVCRGVITEFVA